LRSNARRNAPPPVWTRTATANNHRNQRPNCSHTPVMAEPPANSGATQPASPRTAPAMMPASGGRSANGSAESSSRDLRERDGDMAATHSTWTTPTAHITRGDWVEEGDERVACREMTLHFL